MICRSTNKPLVALSVILLLSAIHVHAGELFTKKEAQTVVNPDNLERYPLYPVEFDECPSIPSPYQAPDGEEYFIVCTNEKKYSIIPATLTNRRPSDPWFQNRGYIYGNQLHIDGDDFPTLLETGLHDEEALKGIGQITGKSINEINKIAKPELISGAGFIARDEDIVSVLIGDNRLVSNMGLKHPQLARVLFHIYHLMILETRHNKMGHHWTHIDHVLYNHQKIQIGGNGSKGYQESLFNDEVRGNMELTLSRELNGQEAELLKKKYGHLKLNQFGEMVKRLTHIHTGEMVPYYIMRYGFYEGHTDYRADPISLAWLFGLRSLEEIEKAFPGKLDQALLEHFSPESITQR